MRTLFGFKWSNCVFQIIVILIILNCLQCQEEEESILGPPKTKVDKKVTEEEEENFDHADDKHGLGARALFETISKALRIVPAPDLGPKKGNISTSFTYLHLTLACSLKLSVCTDSFHPWQV